ncbi:MAG: acyl carrier protein [Buchnera aphidicola (Brevicoryne brassicae)]|uniref:Acyl carrier protein n=1 Tax=Buchnera aphidicola (Brevicoryne brassicae) TaxID=911343 RepID=A0AAJ5PU46_9GAMM|nr:acyl carrier protein [Buchnera aphidicola]QCI19912.1 acyl carrier protein [Buchnera aphidicola (Brevicoryne brassicae)]WAI18735.1 MAG: acyl carrier protein [Buchnera aphidicola (Brevicoryne brassicae)]
MKNVEKRIKKIITDKLDIKEENIINKSSFTEDLGADSLDIVELIMALEEEFDIEISDEDAEKISTIQESIDYIKSRFQK